MKTLLTTLGDRIYAERKARRMTQKELAEKVGVNKSSVSLWESGFVKGLDGFNMVNTAIALGVDPIWLATGKGDKNAQPKDPMRNRVDLAMKEIKTKIDMSEQTFTEEELRRIYRFCVDIALDLSIDDQSMEEQISRVIGK